MELYPFQSEDVAKIARQKAGLIASEMGTGKTHEAIAIDEKWWNATRQASGGGFVPPTLVVAPLNTFSSWQEKYASQSPDTTVFTIDRKNRNSFIQAIMSRKADVYLMHWDALRLMPELRQFQFNTIIGDEIHRVSNRKAQATIALKKLKSNYRLALSGTASGDKPQNLWSILNWLWPTFYRSYWRFVDHYCVFQMEYRGTSQYRVFAGVKNELSLHKEMSPWFVRHLKREPCCPHHPQGVMEWLPDKTYTNLWVDLESKQRKIYDQMRKEMVAWVNEHESTPLVASVVVAQMTRLSQMALATPVIEGGRVRLEAPSSKIDAVKELILDAEETKKFVVFTSSKQAAYLAARAFDASGIPSKVLSGDTVDTERHELVNQFIANKFRVFVAVIQAGAEGIDGLQHATDTAIFLDRSWSTIKNKQAEDRLHRGGQKDTVQIIDVMARHTIDLGRKQRLENKWAYIKAILGDNNIQEKIMEE